MPLSEEELRLLEQMERALVAEDPKLASTLRGTRIRQKARRHMYAGILVFALGIAVLMWGAVFKHVEVAVLGFVVMLAAAYFATISWRHQNHAFQPEGRPGGEEQGLRVIEGGKARRSRKNAKAPKQAKAAKQPKQGTMMERLEERWRRRRDQNGGF